MEDVKSNETAQEQDATLLGGAQKEDFQKESDDNQEQMIDVQETQKDTPKFEKPDDIPSDFWDEDNGTFKGNELYEEYKKEKEKALGLRQKLAKGAPKPPESPQDYKIDKDVLAERLNVEIPDDDAGFNIFKDVAHKHGLDQETFQNVYLDYMEKAIEHNGSMEDQPANEEQQKEYIADEMKKLGDNAPQIVNTIKNWNKQLFNEGILSKEDLEASLNMGRSASEIRVINAYRQAAGNIAIPEKVGVIDGAESYEEIQSIMSKPEYKSDPALQKKVQDYFERTA